MHLSEFMTGYAAGQREVEHSIRGLGYVDDIDEGQTIDDLFCGDEMVDMNLEDEEDLAVEVHLEDLEWATPL